MSLRSQAWRCSKNCTWVFLSPGSGAGQRPREAQQLGVGTGHTGSQRRLKGTPQLRQTLTL